MYSIKVLVVWPCRPIVHTGTPVVIDGSVFQAELVSFIFFLSNSECL